MGNIKEINIKNPTYYFFDDMINIKGFDSNLLKIDKKSYKNIDIYCIGYMIMKDSDYVKLNSANPLYLIIDKVDGCIECNSIEEKNWNKYLTLVLTDKNKELIMKYTEVWDKFKNMIKKINGGKAGECEKDFMLIKFNSDDNLPLNKILNLHNMTIVIRSVFQEDEKYYPQAFLMNVFMNYKC